mmetsp:Transcript_17057/g.35482  ORF Transcript_17057/g.35482 Transcript_17057/m.35482 type:complete len:898 (-) Transcript_17057:3163-5856(-)|eukprot:CAMPEP_0184684274 /NCGR_PEP_ID=MMETSP0312-20130426/14591_1 /TAXON_ID=31354 /ORGANISM="Compsopogon coeruleus, Strain SAG 36.94" /LENGTH=897 /DNA_ID=CAMNT_0027137293 /DNA_START=20 /DNA_END=2713 /DNA_ORIENTATION=-
MGRFHFDFAKLLGGSHGTGPAVFSRDCILSATGGRVTVFDLRSNNSRTFPFEVTAGFIRALAVSPLTMSLLLVASESSRGERQGSQIRMVHLAQGMVVHQFALPGAVHAAGLSFSPCEKFFAVGAARRLTVWKVPSDLTPRFLPFERITSHTHHTGDITCVAWSADSGLLATGSVDGTVRVYSLDLRTSNSDGQGHVRPLTLWAHRDQLVQVSFVGDHALASVSRDGVVYGWKLRRNSSPSLPQFAEARVRSKHFAKAGPVKWVRSAHFHPNLGLLLVGQSNGVFALYKLPHELVNSNSESDDDIFRTPTSELSTEFSALEKLSSLSSSKHSLTHVEIDPSGEWLALGSADSGELLVWEWRSETYVLKQQGHVVDATSLAFSADGRTIATGGEDGMVKIWSAASGYCLATFSDHSASVTSVAYSSKNVVVSSSLDGTVRAYDIKRLRCFRIMNATPPLRRFSCVALDQSGDLVAASCSDTFEIILWSLRTGKVVDMLAGHTGPVACLSFHPNRGTLASASWDASVRLWDVYSSGAACETINLSREVLAVAYRPDGKELACSTMSGEITIWDSESVRIVGSIDGRRDAAPGRSLSSKTVASEFGHFSSLSYSADGQYLLAGGDSRFVCVYNADLNRSLSLLERVEITRNSRYEGVLDKLSSRQLAESGIHQNLLEAYDSDDQDYDSLMVDAGIQLPGSSLTRGSLSKRRKRLQARVRCVAFSGTGRAWAAASTEGLLLYSADNEKLPWFDPSDLDTEVTPESVRSACERGEHVMAMRLALRLSDGKVLDEVMDVVPGKDIVRAVDAASSSEQIVRMTSHLSNRLDKSPLLERNLLWLRALIFAHGASLSAIGGGAAAASLRDVQRAALAHWERLSTLCLSNQHRLELVISRGRARLDL